MSTTATTPLPAFLRLRGGCLELVMHCTWGQTFEVCRKKFELEYAIGVENAMPRPALSYGGAVHEALAYRYRNLQDPVAVVEPRQFAILDGWFKQQPQLDTEWRNAGRAQDLIRAYNAEYPAYDWEVLGVEEEFEVLVGEVSFDCMELNLQMCKDLGISTDSELIQVYLRGRKDLIVSWHGGIWVLDHKTTTEWGRAESKNRQILEGRMSFQFRGYTWAERERQRHQISPALADALEVSDRCTLPVLGAIGSYLVSREPYIIKPAKPMPRNEFHLVDYPFDSRILDEWREECLGMAEEILHCHATGNWRRNRCGCGHWGKCEFYDYCEASPKDREYMLSSSEFRPKVMEPVEL